MTPKPLDGVRVVDLTRYLPGPSCTRLLADLGAEVVKVESPSGDPMRPFAAYGPLNAGKRVLTIDLRTPQGRQALDDLLASADACLESFRPDTARAIGVDGETLRARHPHLVHCSISGYGQSGPDRDRSGHDINYQAEAGLLPDPPAAPVLLLADLTGGLHAAICILAALVSRGRIGGGAAIEVSLRDAAASWRAYEVPAVLRGGHACYTVYEAADRQWLALGALEPKFWARFCTQVARPDWIARQFDAEPAQGELLREVRALMRGRDRAAWLRAFAGVDCCLSPVG